MDALDTLYIMEMFEEFDAATDWVEKNLDFNVVRKRVRSASRRTTFQGSLDRLS